MSPGLPAGVTTALAATTVLAYMWGRAGFALHPVAMAALGLAGGAAFATALRRASHPMRPDERPLGTAWIAVVVSVLAGLVWPVWPGLLPPGGASDLTHHLLLVDALERTGHLVDGVSAEAAMGEMAHYTPGLHLLVVIAGGIAGVEAYRAAYPLLALTVALKAGFLLLITYDALVLVRARLALALTAVALVLFAPRAYTLDGFLQAGFYAQVAAEVFVVAGWWGLARWWASPSPTWLALVGLMGAAVFLVWPIWIGPLLVTAALTVLLARRVPWPARVLGLAMATGPAVTVAALHLLQHAAWLRMAGTSGAVPALEPGALGWALMVLGTAGAVTALAGGRARVTVWFAAAVAAQGVALWMLARARGAETPYMAMKMIYLAVYPIAVLAAVGVGVLVDRVREPFVVAWATAMVILGVGLRAAMASPVPPPLVDPDLAAAGRWARANVPAHCVDYIVDNAEQAYWLHLAVLGQPRSSPRTADIDGYTTNRAVGRWLERSALPYAIARRDLLPGELVRDAELVAEFRTAVVIRRPGGACPLPTAH